MRTVPACLHVSVLEKQDIDYRFITRYASRVMTVHQILLHVQALVVTLG